MRKASIVTVTALALFGSLAVAAPPPMKSSTTFTDNGTTLVVAGNLLGLASGDLEITLEATGTETVVCADAGGMDPPPKEIVLVGTKVVTAATNTPVTFADLASSIPPAPVCGQIEGDPLLVKQDVAFTKASLEIRPVQPDPMLPPLKPVRCIQCSFKAPTIDGPAKPQQCLILPWC
ncbi:hypothetical protein SAMN02745121_05549 [Nannocystis exedens]|uniref:IPT/TIG domain-containing protein n=1 Tax=Nannocystis exedens TaxID=54 RepID=A0A1I2DEZ2_9BACT|nr:hypothetical protein [Nannocystis exedens]PCC70566.1 hypothetical protein NAEX_03630 [Nannocystis exedens]SFE78733.1 hypothetical protein SAMN02745121_05549 [Nannocystis exedens]